MNSKKVFKEEISIIEDIASAFTRTGNFDSTAHLALELALSYTHAKSGSILLLDKNGDLIIHSSLGMSKEIIKKIRDKASRRRNALTHMYKTKTMICYPLLIKDELLGIINVNNKDKGKVFTENDITLLRILAHQIAVSMENSRLMSELQSASIAIDERNRQLIDADRRKTEFIAHMAHELRTPMNAIKGAVYYMEGKKLEKSELSEFISILSGETDKVITLLDALLDYSPHENEKEVIRKKFLSVTDVLTEVLSSRMIQEIFSRKRISVQIHDADSPSGIIGEKARLVQAIINIIDGLSEFTRARDVIEIIARRKKNSVTITFLIKGRRIDDNELPFIFNERCLWYDMNLDKDLVKFFLAGKTIELHKGTASALNSPEGIKIILSFPINRKEHRDAQLDQLMSTYISFVASALNVNKCSLMLYDQRTKYLTIRSAIGLREDIVRKTRVKIGERIAGKVALGKKALFLENIESSSEFHRKNATQYHTKSLLCIPLIVNNRITGVLNLNNRADGAILDRKDLYLASLIADRISNIISKMQNSITDTELKLLERGMEDLLQAERMYKKKNAEITELVFGIMNVMNQSADITRKALYASRLYDLGMTQIDDSIVLKSDDLSAIERKILRTHPFPGLRLIDTVEPDDIVKRSILHHHEKYDGTGYPAGLKGNDIPFISRVLAVVDSYAAMVTDRPYRKAIAKTAALKEIRACSGTQFDPEVVAAFTSII